MNKDWIKGVHIAWRLDKTAKSRHILRLGPIHASDKEVPIERFVSWVENPAIFWNPENLRLVPTIPLTFPYINHNPLQHRGYYSTLVPRWPDLPDLGAIMS